MSAVTPGSFALCLRSLGRIVDAHPCELTRRQALDELSRIGDSLDRLQAATQILERHVGALGFTAGLAGSPATGDSIEYRRGYSAGQDAAGFIEENSRW